MRYILLIVALCISHFLFSQTTGYFRFDSVRFEKIGGNSELILLNATRGVTNGVLTNVGNGRTAFMAPSAGVTGGNLGSGYRYWVPSSSGFKTTIADNGLGVDSATPNILTYKLGGTLTQATTINQSTNAFNITGSGQLSLGQTISGSLARVVISNPTTATQNLFVGNVLHTNNVYFSVNHQDTLTTNNNKSTGLFNQYKHVIQNNMTVSGWGFGNHWTLMVPDTSRVDPVGSDLAGSALFRTLIEPNTAVATGKHTVKGGTFRDDHVGGVISMVENSNTNSSNWVHRKGYWASFIAHQNFGNSKDSIETWTGYWVTNINAGYGQYANLFYAGPVGGFDTVRSFYSPYQNARFHQAASAYFGSAVNGNPYVADASAQVEIYSTTKGILIPRMTGAQMAAISSPATSLLIYNTDSTAYCYYNGAAWVKIGAAAGGGGSQTWQQTLTTGSTLTGDNSIAGGGFNFYHTNTGNYRVYGSGSFSAERLLVTSGAAGVAILGRESTSVYFQGSDSLYTVGLGQIIDTTTWKVQVRNSTTGALAYAPWLFAGGGTTDWSLAGNAATAGSQTGSFLGTTNNVQLRIRTNNAERVVVDSAINQIRIGGATRNTTDGLIIQAPGNGNADGIKIYALGGVTPLTIGQAQITRGGGIDFNTSSGGISFSPTTGVAFGKGQFGTPTSKVHIGASTTTANTGQIKLDEGSRQTTPENGTINYVSNNIEFVETSTVYIIAKTLTATATLDFPSTNSGTSNTLTITVTGAVTGDPVAIAAPHSVAGNSGIIITGWVSSADTVTVSLANISGSAFDASSASYTASVIHY